MFAAAEFTDNLRQDQENAMFSSIRRRPIKFVCDAPAYVVVKASSSVGMQSPEDVRWRRQSMPKGETAKRESLARRMWRLLFSFGASAIQETCACGNHMPERRFVVLRKRTGEEVRYSMTQCERCRSIAWDEEGNSAATQPCCGHQA